MERREWNGVGKWKRGMGKEGRKDVERGHPLVLAFTPPPDMKMKSWERH